jgi:hypothetical protein
MYALGDGRASGAELPNYPPTFDGVMMLYCVRRPPQPGQTNGRIPATRASPPRFLMRAGSETLNRRRQARR